MDNDSKLSNKKSKEEKFPLREKSDCCGEVLLLS
jgi:hypothetical protein